MEKIASFKTQLKIEFLPQCTSSKKVLENINIKCLNII